LTCARAQWPTDHDMFAMCMMACQCALELQKEVRAQRQCALFARDAARLQLHNYPVPGGVLTLHSGVGCGELTGM
jgi:hypothetical protein